MNTQAIVHDALRCLQELDLHPFIPLFPSEISRRRNVPLSRCLRAIHRLSLAGITRTEVTGEVVLVKPLAELTPDQVLDAVWTSFQKKPVVEMLIPTIGDRALDVIESALDLEISVG